MRLLLVEDDPHIARELLLRWSNHAWIVRHAGSLGEADDAMLHDAFDFIMLDLGLPDGDGMAWLEALRLRDRNVPVLVVTARDRVSDRVQGLKLGADDYLVKPFAVEELDARIEVLMRRVNAATDRAIRFGPLTLLEDESRVYVEGKPLELSPRELEVLDILMRRSPRLVPKRALVDALSRRNLDINDTAADVYISRLRKKLECTGVEIRTLRGVGYQLAVSAAAVDPGGA